MHASEGAEQLRGASERVRRALDKVAAAETALARARRELQAVQRSEYGWTDGLAGRRLVAEGLTALAPAGWTFLDAVHWPGRPGMCIDHVGVGPGGVVVMFSRQWAGAVEVRGGVLRQNGIPRLREAAAVAAAAGAVSALLEPVFRTAVSAFVCAVQHEVRAATVAPGVNVVGVRDVGRAVAALPPRLTPGQVGDVLDSLRAALVGAQAPDLLTTRALTAYCDGPAVPWPARTEDRLFDAGPPSGEVAPWEQPGPPATPAPQPPVQLGTDPPAFPVPSPPLPGRVLGAVPGAGDLLVDDGLDDRPPAGRGRHRAPSRHSTRTAHRAAVRDLPAARVAVAAAAGTGLVGVAAWLGVLLL